MLFAIGLPLACGLLFPLGAWWLKQGLERARDLWGGLMVGNAFMLLPYLPALRDPGAPPPAALACGVLFFLGQAAAAKSFQAGDLSLAVPLQGVKVPLVALMTWGLLGESPGWTIWIAALLAPLALYGLGDHVPGARETARFRLTLLLSLAAAVAFAGVDVILQAFASGEGVLRFGVWTFGVQAALSACLYFLPGRARRFRYPARAWAPLLAGSLLMSLLSFGLVLVIAMTGHAARVNVLFNSRVLWSVLIVAVFGRLLAMREAAAPGSRRRLGRRLAGAGLMMAAIVLAVL